MPSRRAVHLRHLSVGIVVLALPILVFAAAPLGGGDDPGGQATAEDVTALVAYVVLALLFSFLCSISEAVLLSLTPSYIEGLAEHKPGLARRLRRLKVEDIDRSLAAILTLNTIAHTVGAIGSGAKAVVVFGSAYFGVFSAVMTLAILFLSEIVPKTIGAVFWRGLAGPTAWFVQVLIWLLFPLIAVSERITRLIARGRTAHIFSRDELAAMASIGEQAGQLDPGESRIIRNLLLLDRLAAGDIMTPRPVITALPERITVAEALELIGERPFSRLPIYRDVIDRVTGFVLKHEVLLNQAEGRGDRPLTELRREMPSVPASLPLRRLLEVLLETHRAHIALVIDEYGGTAGLVTLEDAVETLLGLEIVDEMDETVDMQALARRRWAERARTMGLVVDDELDPGRGT
jgi:CBS domain containing-hemolysin-like protein